MTTHSPSVRDEPTLPIPPVVTGPPGPLPPVPGEPPPEPPNPRRHRRGLLITLIAVAAALVLAVPLVVLALVGSDQNPGAAPSARPSTPVSRPASPSPPPPSASGTGRAPAPDGRIPLSVLRNATLYIPAWPADNMPGPSGQLHFRNGEAIETSHDLLGKRVFLGRVGYGDVDRDGAQETILEVSCMTQGGAQQLIGLDRTAAGDIVTMGTVVNTTGQIRQISQRQAFAVTSDGTVSALLGDYQPCCSDNTPPQFQWRGYGWTGTRFHQVAGPTSFPPNPRATELSLSAGELVLGPAVNGVRHGTLTLTVTHLYGTPPDHVVAWIALPDGMRRDGSAWPPVRATGPGSFNVDLPAPPTGGSRTYHLAFQQAATAPTGTLAVQVHGATADGSRLGDHNPYNNTVHVAVRVVD